MGRHMRWQPKEFFISEETEKKYIREKYGRTSWQYRTVRFVHSHAVQITLASLLVLDVICLIAELILDSHFPNCSTVLDTCAVAGAPTPTAQGHRGMLHPLSGGDHSPAPGELYCTHHPHWVHDLHEALFGISLVILSIFLVELFALLAAVKSLFFRNLFYMIDFVVVTTSLVLEIIFHSEMNDGDAVGFLILVRLWRFMRIGHAIFTDTHEYVSSSFEGEVEHLKHRIKGLEKYKAKATALLKEQGVALPEEPNDEIEVTTNTATTPATTPRHQPTAEQSTEPIPSSNVN